MKDTTHSNYGYRYSSPWTHIHTSMPTLHIIASCVRDFFPEFPYKYSTTYQALAVLRWWDEISATSASIFSYLIRYLSHLSSIRYKGCGRQSTTFNSWVLSLVKCRWVSMGKQFGRHWTASLLVVHIAITCELLCILSLLVLRRDQRINCDLGQGLQLVPIEIEAFFWRVFFKDTFGL